MRPQIALDLALDGITLLSRAPDDGADAGRWWREGSVRLDAPDIEDALGRLRDRAVMRAGKDFASILIVPDSQVLYTSLERDDRDARVTIRSALRGRTPYEVEDLAFAHAVRGDRLQVAVVAIETLLEAEAFATDHGFRPVAVVADPADGIYPGPAEFGPTGIAPEIAGGARVDLALGAGFDVVPAPEPDAEPQAVAEPETVAPVGAAASDDAPSLNEAPPLEEAAPSDIGPSLPEESDADSEPDSAPVFVRAPRAAPPIPPGPAFATRRGGMPAKGDAPAAPRLDRIAPRIGTAPDAPPRAQAEPLAAESAASDARPPAAAPSDASGPGPVLVAAKLAELRAAQDAALNARPATSTAQARRATGSGAPILAATGTTALSGAAAGAIDATPPEAVPTGRLRTLLRRPARRTDATTDASPAGIVPASGAARGRTGLILTGGLVGVLLAVGGLSLVLTDEDVPTASVMAPAVDESGAAPARATESGRSAIIARAPADAAALPDRAASGKAAAESADPVPRTDLAALLPASGDAPAGDAGTAPLVPAPEVAAAGPAEPDAEGIAIEGPALEDPATDDVAVTSAEGPAAETQAPVGAIASSSPVTEPTGPTEPTAQPDEGTAPVQTASDDPSPAAETPDTGDETALVAATPDGLAAPGGYTVVAGRPTVLPEPRPEDLPGAAPAEGDDAAPSTADLSPEEVARREQLARVRPVRRPGDVAQSEPSVSDDDPAEVTLTPAELALRRFQPRPRPAAVIRAATAAAEAEAERVSEMERAAAEAEAAAAVAAASQAAAASLATSRADARVVIPTGPVSRLALPASERPRGRPRAVEREAAQIVARRRAEPAAPTRSAAAAAAPAAPVAASRQTLRASPNSVARAATDDNAIRLNQVNLIGVYGQPSSRRALIRLGNGRYVKVQVGDRLDRGRVTAIGENQVSYQRGNRSIVLRMPRA